MNHAEHRSGGARTADSQRERNHPKSREIFIPAAQGLQPRISASFISLGLIVVRRIGGAQINAAISGLFIRRISIYVAKERDKSHEKPLREEEPRDQKSPRFLVALPAPNISEILEPCAFLKSFKSSEILEPLGSPQEAF